MPLSITQVFGYAPTDNSPQAIAQRQSEECPFTRRKCWKSFRSGGVIHGTCAVQPPTSDEVIVCPQRMYAGNYEVLRHVAVVAFGPDAKVIRAADIISTQGERNRVVAFGQGWGGELRVPKSAEETGDYAVDWILALITEDGELQEFLPIEVQTMDTTGSYQREWYRLFGLQVPPNCKSKSSNINWENVHKRIIPQLMSKGNVFRREALCKKGLFFICPEPVYRKFMGRMGTILSEFPLGSGALTFRRYQLSSNAVPGEIRPLEFTGQFTTTVENLRDAFNSTLGLPSMGVMSVAIQKALHRTLSIHDRG
jgi:hypothetical protein